MNYHAAKVNMIKQQINTLGNIPEKVTDILIQTPREDFVPEGMKSFAYTDMEIPLEHGEKMFTPRTEALILDALNLQSKDHVLEIGTGSGYFTALLASLCETVTTVDIHESFSKSAKYKLKALNIFNVKYATGNAAHGWEEDKHYDVIVIHGSLTSLPETYLAQLKENGRLFYAYSSASSSNLAEGILIEKNKNNIEQKNLFDIPASPLKEATKLNSFTF